MFSYPSRIGFAGHELPTTKPPPFDVYIPSTDTWFALTPAPDPVYGCPGPRSVCGLVAFTVPSSSAADGEERTDSSPIPVALLYYGEKAPSSLGHAGAGEFWDDAWVLFAYPGPSLQTAKTEWKKLDLAGTPICHHLRYVSVTLPFRIRETSASGMVPVFLLCGLGRQHPNCSYGRATFHK